MEDEILNKNFDDDSETENYSLNESSDVSTDEECDSILTTVQMSSSNCFIGKNGYRWNKNHAIIGRTRSHNIITHLPGLKGPAKPKPNCGIDIFNLFFTAAIIKQISEFTNAKIEEFRQRISDLTKSTYSNFTSEIEIRAFLGLLYLAGVYKSGHENVESLFASDGTGRDIFRSVMSVKRFLFLLLCIRFDNFKTRCKEDRLSPIRDIFQTIIEKFQSCYTPAEYLTVDEMLVGFRGKCPFKIYIPSKPNKYGIKIVILADSRTHYMYNAMVYTGKSKTPKSKELSLPTQIVLDISRPLWKSNRNITADNWFTSIELVDKLKEHGLTYLGTMRKNKPQIPPQFQPHPKRESGTSIFGFSGTKTLVSYVPKKRKSVILISSMHHDNKCDETTGTPDIIMDYNLTKGGVDTIDQIVSNFSTSRRSRRSPLALFYALLDITALNSYIIFNYQIDKKDQKERSTFIVDLGRSLIDEHLATRNLNSLPLELQTTIKKFKNNDGSSTSRGSTMPQESDTPKRCYKCPSKNAGKVKTLCSNMENTCPFQGCSQTYRNTLEAMLHSSLCQFCIVDCPQSCGTKILRKDLASHMTVACKRQFGCCQFCGALLTRDSLQQHEALCGQIGVSPGESVHSDSKNPQSCILLDQGCRNEAVVCLKEKDEKLLNVYLPLICDSLRDLSLEMSQCKNLLKENLDQIKVRNEFRGESLESPIIQLLQEISSSMKAQSGEKEELKAWQREMSALLGVMTQQLETSQASLSQILVNQRSPGSSLAGVQNLTAMLSNKIEDISNQHLVDLGYIRTELEGVKSELSTGPTTTSLGEDHLQGLERDLKNTKEELETVMAGYQVAINELSTMKTELQNTKGELNALNSEIHVNKNELKAMQIELIHKNEEIEIVKKGVNCKDKKIDSLKKDLQDIKEKLESVKTEQQGTKEELESVKTEKQGTKEKLESVKTELQGTKEELESVKTEQHDTKEELESVKTELQDTKKELATVRTELQTTTTTCCDVKCQELENPVKMADVGLDLKLGVQNWLPPGVVYYDLRNDLKKYLYGEVDPQDKLEFFSLFDGYNWTEVFQDRSNEIIINEDGTKYNVRNKWRVGGEKTEVEVSFHQRGGGVNTLAQFKYFILYPEFLVEKYEEFKKLSYNYKMYPSCHLTLTQKYSAAYLIRVIAILLIIGGVELNPGPPTKKQTTLSTVRTPETKEVMEDDLKSIVIQIHTELRTLGARLESRLHNIEQKFDEWDQRLTVIETSQKTCLELATKNDLRIKTLEDHGDMLDRKTRENNLIFYGIKGPEAENSDETLCKLVTAINEKMQIQIESEIMRCHRLSKKANAPILVEIPKQTTRIALLRNSYKLRGDKIFVNKDYTLKTREQRRLLITKKKELSEKGIHSKLRDNKLFANGQKYEVVDGRVVGEKGSTS
ncbi:hypothetical protein LAZ67_7003537 [Cordylochernes scorpioides]|uniref:TRAF-type domain-containing protein n=1 Tax=Cordylochernes scorpioides TaxID=51811 RepID=A0ABY6KTZ2_9ARAC|nr:hypothetical protein LAZ67_7003537 [Cordylochernes scorpioides]